MNHSIRLIGKLLQRPGAEGIGFDQDRDRHLRLLDLLTLRNRKVRC